jgi:hypothetical protein
MANSHLAAPDAPLVPVHRWSMRSRERASAQSSPDQGGEDVEQPEHDASCLSRVGKGAWRSGRPRGDATCDVSKPIMPIRIVWLAGSWAPATAQRPQSEPGIRLLDGDMAELDGLRVAGLGGVVGNPNRPHRRTPEMGYGPTRVPALWPAVLSEEMFWGIDHARKP